MIPLTTADHTASAIGIVLRPMLAKMLAALRMETRARIISEPQISLIQDAISHNYHVSITFNIEHRLI